MKDKTKKRVFAISLALNAVFLILWTASNLFPCAIRTGDRSLVMVSEGHFFYSWFDGNATDLTLFQRSWGRGGIFKRVATSPGVYMTWTLDFGSRKTGPTTTLVRRDIIFPLSVPTLAFFLVNAWIIRKRLATRRIELLRSGVCVKCRYNLKGNISGVCPECGSPVGDPAGLDLTRKRD
ncbi:MAG: hypothetical protein H6819_07390 [Phycisphaerales bacterium]|nr:hypothetical protein [Phycisphaerales bacterium]MCB9857683.1 hypothetical protein [Phycisphaerales bacterium]MCB9864772.1 hypothetical protein [Phycisphaerales bacterium]